MAIIWARRPWAGFPVAWSSGRVCSPSVISFMAETPRRSGSSEFSWQVARFCFTSSIRFGIERALIPSRTAPRMAWLPVQDAADSVLLPNYEIPRRSHRAFPRPGKPLFDTCLRCGHPALIPLPQKITYGEGTFEMRPDTRIVVDKASRETGEYLAERLRRSTGYPFKVQVVADASPEKSALGAIFLTTRDASATLGVEG